jgi:DNA modification methylase
MSVAIIQADARAIPLKDARVQCVVTSPPYWGLRKYAGVQDLIWGRKCGHADHEWTANGFTREHPDRGTIGKDANGSGLIGGFRDQPSKVARGEKAPLGDTCALYGAWRGGFGLEPTIEMYIAHTVEILRELRRVLRPDGVVFWNIGDSYANDGKWGGETGGMQAYLPDDDRTRVGREKRRTGLKPKDLCLIPSRVALAAQADGWWVRSLIIWAKPNPMPESCQDRPTDAYEYIIMLTKSERYFWDADAVREPAATDDMRRPYGSEGMWQMDGRPLEQRHGGKPRAHSRGNGNGGPKAQTRGSYEGFSESARDILAMRNMRNVWQFPTQPYKGAHFATFPEEIPRRCIMAATSERGCCASCGTPLRRVVKCSGGTIGMGDWVNKKTQDETGKTRKHSDVGAASSNGTYDRETVGWKPGCKCFDGSVIAPEPCLVLDPFGGSGTTARVAVSLNRRAVSMDLAYHDHAQKRTRNVQRQLAVT